MAEAEADIEAHVDVEAVGHPEPREHSFFFITVFMSINPAPRIPVPASLPYPTAKCRSECGHCTAKWRTQKKETHKRSLTQRSTHFAQ